MFVDRAPESMSPLPAGYRTLLARLLDVAAADDRVRSVWLSGSVGRGVADAGSDLDVVLSVADDAFDEFAASWREWLRRVTPVVLARELPRMPGSWYSLTPGCERFDVVTERAGTSSPGAARHRRLVLAKDGQPDPPPRPGRPEAAKRAAGPDPAKLTGIVEEFLRQQAIFPASVVARGDWLLGVQGVQAAQQMLYELFVEANQPLPPMGVKQWSARLTPAQQQICAGLPPPRADRDGVTAAMRAAASTFRSQARQILAEHDTAWPDELDAAVLRYQAGAGQPGRPAGQAGQAGHQAGAAVRIAAYDPDWPRRFTGLAATFRAALGGVAERIDHIGSTSVPGLAAKPVIDIQVSVAGLEPAEPFAGPLRRLGLVYRDDNPDRSKRYFREPPGQPRTHVHVRRAGSFGEQLALLFRDYLRFDAGTAAQYEAVKYRLAAQFGTDAQGYTAAKGPFIWEVIRRADEWAQRTGWTPDRSDS